MNVQISRTANGAVKIIQDDSLPFYISGACNVMIAPSHKNTTIHIDVDRGRILLSYLFANISTINGVAPSDIGDALNKLADEVFNGA